MESQHNFLVSQLAKSTEAIERGTSERHHSHLAQAVPFPIQCTSLYSSSSCLAILYLQILVLITT